MSPLDAPAVQLTGALLLAGVLLPAGFSKLRAQDETTGVVEQYRLLPGALVRPAALVLPLLELSAGLALLLPAARPAGGAGAAALLLLFALAMAINLGRGRSDIDCGCFLGRQRQRISWGLVGRNLVLAAIGLGLARAPVAPAPGALELVVVALAVLSLLSLYAAFSRLAGLAPLARPARAR